MGGAHSRLLVHIASPTSPPYVGTQLTALFHTATVEMPFLWHCSTNGKLRILLLPDTNLLPQVGITHYSQLLTRQHSTKLLFFF